MKSPILIVEDDTAVRDSLRMVLEIYGYAVEIFASGEALLAYEDLGDSHCVILDVNLPGQADWKPWRGVRIVVISGSTDYRRYQAMAMKQRYALRFPDLAYGIA